MQICLRQPVQLPGGCDDQIQRQIRQLIGLLRAVKARQHEDPPRPAVVDHMPGLMEVQYRQPICRAKRRQQARQTMAVGIRLDRRP
ncbi:hypothetical protein D3C78_1333140 [compost metagenome]